MVNSSHRRRNEEQARTEMSALHKRQLVACLNLAILRMQQMPLVTARAAKTAELPEWIGARVVLAWAPEHHDEYSVAHVGLFFAASCGFCARNHW